MSAALDRIGSPKDPLDLERLAAEERLASTPVGSRTLAESHGKGKKKRTPAAYEEPAAHEDRPTATAYEEAATLVSSWYTAGTPGQENQSGESDDESDVDTDSGSEDEAAPKRKRVSLDPKRIILHDIDKRVAFTLPLEQAEYIRQQLSIEQPDDIVQRIVLEKSPVPENIQQPPRLDDYFRDLLAEQGMGHARGIDTTLMRMQDNIRNILGPLTAAWSGLEEDHTTVEKMRLHNEKMRQQTEKAVILVGKAFYDLTTMRRFSLIDALKKSASRTKRLLSRVQCKKSATLFGKSFEKKLIKMTKTGCPSKAVAQALRDTPAKPSTSARQHGNQSKTWNNPKPWQPKPWQESNYRVNKKRGSQRGRSGRSRGR